MTAAGIKDRSLAQRDGKDGSSSEDLEDLDEGGASKEEAKHVGHDVVTDHAGDGNDEPDETRAVSIAALKHRDVNCAREQTCARSPDHPLKQVMDDEVRLGHHDQQSHMGPTKLEKETGSFFNTFERRKKAFLSACLGEAFRPRTM